VPDPLPTNVAMGGCLYPRRGRRSAIEQGEEAGAFGGPRVEAKRGALVQVDESEEQ